MRHHVLTLVAVALQSLILRGEANPQPFFQSIVNGFSKLLYGAPKVTMEGPSALIEQKLSEKSLDALDELDAGGPFSPADKSIAGPEGRFLFGNPFKDHLLLTKGVGHSILFAKIESVLERLTNIDQDLDELDDINDTLNSIRDAVTTLTAVLNGLVNAVAALDSSFTIVITQLNQLITNM